MRARQTGVRSTICLAPPAVQSEPTFAAVLRSAQRFQVPMRQSLPNKKGPKWRATGLTARQRGRYQTRRNTKVLLPGARTALASPLGSAGPSRLIFRSQASGVSDHSWRNATRYGGAPELPGAAGTPNPDTSPVSATCEACATTFEFGSVVFTQGCHNRLHRHPTCRLPAVSSETAVSTEAGATAPGHRHYRAPRKTLGRPGPTPLRSLPNNPTS